MRLRLHQAKYKIKSDDSGRMNIEYFISNIFDLSLPFTFSV